MKITNTKNAEGVEETSGLELLTKYCSRLCDILGYPYFFNWSFPTNHRDGTEDGEILDTTYAIFRVGKYPQHPLVQGYVGPVEKQTVFGLSHTIAEQHRGPVCFVEDHGIELKSLEDVEKYADLIKSGIDSYLDAAATNELNRAIDRFNIEYPDPEPVPPVVTTIVPNPSLLCNQKCNHLSLSEEEQNKLPEGPKLSHLCLLYKERLVHGHWHPELVACGPCLDAQTNVQE